MTLSRDDLERELLRRHLATQEAGGVVAGIRKELFDKQLAVVDDPSRNKAALCTRRAGKTNIWSRYGVITCLLKSRSIVRIWASSRLRCKELMWAEINDVCRRHRIKVKTHETELRVTFENRSEIRLVGADKDKDAQRKRGDKTSLEIVLEAQSFGPFLKSLLEDVIEPSLFDTQGTLCVEGTPGPVCAGYWFSITGREDEKARWSSVGDSDGTGVGWSCHRWSVLDNPFLPHAKEELARLKARKRWTDDNPTWLREYRAKWVNDVGALYYKWSEYRNTYDLNKVKPWGPGWSHVLGWDIGFNDAMALVVWGWHENDNALYECFSWAESPSEWKESEDKRGKSVSEVISEIIIGLQKRFNIVKMVADTGGGGRLFVEEVQSRYGLVFEAAKKTEKYEHVTLMNDDFLTGRIRTISGSVLSVDLSRLPIDPDWEPESGKPPDSDPRFPDHSIHAGLYSWRYAYNYLAEAAPAKKTENEVAEDQFLQQLKVQKDREIWEPEQEYDPYDDADDFGIE